MRHRLPHGVLPGILIALVAIGVGAWGYARAFPRHKAASLEGLEARFEGARVRTREMAMVPLSDRAETERLVRDLVAARLVGTGKVSDPDGLARSVGAFFGARYASEPRDYLDWRRHEGYVPVDMQELRAMWFIEEAHQTYFNEPISSEASWDELHVLMVGGQRTFERGRLNIREIAVSGESVSCVGKRLSRADPTPPRIPGLSGEMLDAGGAISVSLSWWRPAATVEELLARDGVAEICSIGMIAGFGDGVRRPIGMTYVRDPKRSRWQLTSMIVGTAEFQDLGNGGRIEY